MRAKIIAIVLAFLTILGLSGRPLRTAEAQFRFQDNFWVNLHHFVRAEARRRAFNAPLGMPMSTLSEAERSAWSSSVDAYADLAKLSLIFDERLVRINNVLAARGEEAALPEGLVEPGVLAALNRAAPIYRTHLWPEHHRLNEEWIATIRPLVEQHAPALTRALADAYHVQWPKEPILVDASCEGGPVGAYTTGGPPGTAAHTVIAPSQVHDLDAAFEIVFHEASHSVDDQIMKNIDAEAARQKVKPDPNLWHALIFYTSGELVKRELHKEKDPGYKPYAYRFGVYDRGWQPLRAGLEKDWQPYLDGKVSFSQALTRLVADCSTKEEAPKEPGAPVTPAANLLGAAEQRGPDLA
ncbi:MAG TPA: hypothetical protein VFR03_14630 [Thermoanaerobaculia bacterium]|nr:hypothetical protein [Thermoanaerobaculia bacterium]